MKEDEHEKIGKYLKIFEWKTNLGQISNSICVRYTAFLRTPTSPSFPFSVALTSLHFLQFSSVGEKLTHGWWLFWHLPPLFAEHDKMLLFRVWLNVGLYFTKTNSRRINPSIALRLKHTEWKKNNRICGCHTFWTHSIAVSCIMTQLKRIPYHSQYF